VTVAEALQLFFTEEEFLHIT